MLSASLIGLTFDDDDWIAPPHAPKLYRAASVGSWGVTSIGRGFDWDKKGDLPDVHESPTPPTPVQEARVEQKRPQTADPSAHSAHLRKHHHAFIDKSPVIPLTTRIMTSSPQPQDGAPAPCRPTTPLIQAFARSPSSPRPRRRSSQQRVSLVAGRVLIAPIDPPDPPPMLSENLRRTPSSGSILSYAESAQPPTPSADQSFLGGRTISEYVVEGEMGRGAYGLVKRAREILPNETLGVSISNRFQDGCHLQYCDFLASVGDQTGYQVQDIGRLLEKAPKVWHDPDRNLRHVCHLQYLLHLAPSSALGPFSIY